MIIVGVLCVSCHTKRFCFVVVVVVVVVVVIVVVVVVAVVVAVIVVVEFKTLLLLLLVTMFSRNSQGGQYRFRHRDSLLQDSPSTTG